MEDISKEVVAVILVIAIVISVLGTWLVLDSATSYRPSGSNIQSGLDLGGQVGVSVLKEPGTSGIVDTESGQVSVRLVK